MEYHPQEVVYEERRYSIGTKVFKGSSEVMKVKVKRIWKIPFISFHQDSNQYCSCKKTLISLQKQKWML